MLSLVVSGWLMTGCEDFEALTRVCDALAEEPEFDLPPSTIQLSRTASLERGSAVLDAWGSESEAERLSVAAFAIWRDVVLEPDDLATLAAGLSNVTEISGRPCSLTLCAGTSESGGDRIRVRRVPSTGSPAVRRFAVPHVLRGPRLVKALLRFAIEKRRDETFERVDYFFPPHFGMKTEDVVARYRMMRELDPRVDRFAFTPHRAGVRAPITETIAIAEAVRSAAMRSSSARELRSADPTLTGKAPSGEAAIGHAHAFFLPRDLDEDGFIDHVDIWFPTGSSAIARRAALSMREIYDPRVPGRFSIEYEGSPELDRGTTWATATPFVLTRHVKRRPSGVIRADSPADQVIRALRQLRPDIVDALIVQELSVESDELLLGLEPRSFRRIRRNDDELMPAFAATLRFDHDVSGPIVLGRHAHFGLGYFRPIS
jgi:CRISPR-associated protein Csb2